MKKIEASKLNRQLKTVLAGIAAGERYEITRYGKVVAKLLPPGAREPRDVQPALIADERAEQAQYGEEKKPKPTPDEIRAKRRDFFLRTKP